MVSEEDTIEIRDNQNN